METLQYVAIALTIVSTSAGLVALAARVVLLPYLREHLVAPMRIVRDEVKNSHQINLRDDLDAKFYGLERRLIDLDERLGRIEAGQ